MRTESNYIRTYTGRKFWPLDPRPEDVDIADIAHALSNQCRFTGHTSEFYSVAQHCLFVSALCPPELKLAGLLHDADEAYLIDLASPVKHSGKFEEFVEYGAKLHETIFNRYGLSTEVEPQVKPFDRDAYEAERNAFMPTGDGFVPQYLKPLMPRDAERKYLEQFYRLTAAPAQPNDFGRRH